MSDFGSAVPPAPDWRKPFAGAGEMGAHFVAFDWRSTPLGAVDDWPAALRTAASICLHARVPLAVWWGSEFVMVHNDAYLPILGAVADRLGQRAMAVWPEMWHEIGPAAAAVLAGEGAASVEDRPVMVERDGHLEERYFTFSFSPIVDDTGRPGGIFAAVHDTTERVAAESTQRAAAITDALLAASPVGFGWVDTELHFRYVNPALCAINGLSERTHLGRRPDEVFPGPGAEMAELMRRVMRDGPITGVESTAPRRGTEPAVTVHVVASYFPIRIAGTTETVGVGFTIVDVTERTQLLDALGTERARYARLAATDVLAVFSGVDEQITEANDAMLTMLGYTAEDIRAGRLRWPDLTPAGWEDADARAVAQLARTGRTAAYHKEYLHRDGHRVPVLIGVVAFSQAPMRWLAYATDLTAERAAQADLRLFQALVERSADFIAVADIDGATMYLNPAGRQLVGLTGATADAVPVPGAPITAFADAKERDRWRAEMIPTAVREGHDRAETLLYRVDTGEPIDVDHQMFTVATGEGRDATYLAAVSRDITDRQRSLRQAEALAGFAGALNIAEGRQEVAYAVARYANPVFDAASVVIGLCNVQRAVLDVVRSGGEGDADRWETVDLDADTPLAVAARTNEPVARRGAGGDEPGGSIAMPLRYGDGSVLGAIEVRWRNAAPSDEATANLLNTVTQLCSQALQRAELGHATAAVADLAARLSVTRSTEEAIMAILSGAPQALGAALPGLTVREHGRRLRLWHTELPTELVATYADFTVDDPRPTAEVLRTGERIIIPDRAAFRVRYPNLYDHAGERGMQTTVAVPLLDSRGRPMAVLGMGWSRTRPFRDTDLALLDTITDLCEQTLERTRLVAAEHDLVTRLARRLNATPARVPAGFDVAVRYRPALSGLNLGGDWYDLITLPDGTLAVVVGDVLGHDVEAAADMAQLRTIINTLIRLGVDLGDVFPRLTSLTGPGFSGTAIAMIIDPPAEQVRIVRAGHPHPVLMPAGGLPAIVETGQALPLGLVNAPMKVTTAPFCPGDMIIAFTDGLVERRTRSYDDGIAALYDVIAATRGLPVEEAADTILAELPGSDDDQALVVIRRRA